MNASAVLRTMIVSLILSLSAAASARIRIGGIGSKDSSPLGGIAGIGQAVKTAAGIVKMIQGAKKLFQALPGIVAKLRETLPGVAQLLKEGKIGDLLGQLLREKLGDLDGLAKRLTEKLSRVALGKLAGAVGASEFVDKLGAIVTTVTGLVERITDEFAAIGARMHDGLSGFLDALKGGAPEATQQQIDALTPKLQEWMAANMSKLQEAAATAAIEQVERMRAAGGACPAPPATSAPVVP